MSSFKHFGRKRQPKDARRLIIQQKGYGEDWYRQRAKALKRDKYACQKCGYESKRNHVHHIRKIAYFVNSQTCEVNYKEANDLENLMTVCPKCHKILDGHAKFDTFPTF